MRAMGLDVGDKTIGVAVSDENMVLAMPLKVIKRTASVRKDINEIRRLVEELGVTTLVVGMPMTLDGTCGIQAEKVQDFVNELKRRLHMRIETWDERLTTVEAERVLINADEARAKRKAVVDKMAASLILQSYLDRSKQEAQKEPNDRESETA